MGKITLRGVRSRRTILSVLAASLIVSGFLLFYHIAMPSYNIPSDSILITVGPLDGDEKSIRLYDFRFIAYVNERRIKVWGYASFANDKSNNYLDIYLPFVVVSMRSGTYSDMTVSYYKDTVDGTCSLTHVTFPINVSFYQHIVDLDIYVRDLVATRSLGEDTIILTFGWPHSTQFQSLSKYLGQRGVEVAKLTALPVTVGVDKDYFFSETFPDPDVEYLTKDSRFATWLIEFSGRLAGFYRSIHCTARNPITMQLREALVLVSGAIISVGVSMFLDVAIGRYALDLKPKQTNRTV